MIHKEKMSLKQRLERLDTFMVEGRIIRNEWTSTDAEGRETACLLAALSPEVGEHENASHCPAEVMPAWLAYLTPDIDDNVSVEYWPNMLQRYAALAHRWHVLDESAWRRAEYRFRTACIREAMQHTDDERVLKCCRDTIALCKREIADDSPTPEEWAAAGAAAWSAAGVAASAASAAGVAASAASAAAWTAASAARVAGDVGVARAARDAARDAARAAGDAASAAAWDRLTVALFEILESEIERL